MRTETKSYRITLEGLVQGVGFRPFLYQLAQEFRLQGSVMNTGDGLTWDVHGIDRGSLDHLLSVMKSRMPRGARLDRLSIEDGPGESIQGFHIRASQVQRISTMIPLDVAPCPECLRELTDPTNRRYLYPFISCSACGPRFTILRQLPFDRANTSLDEFPLCVVCQQEYADPRDRRFHAQTMSCTDCGPVLTLRYPWDHWSESGRDALREAVKLLRQGGILALKGIGGYQLAAVASDSKAVARLRQQKKRPEKPLAVMFPDLESLEKACIVDQPERAMLSDPAAPIVLLERKPNSGLSELISLDLRYYGAMLPSSPLHFLLLRELQAPLVMTSANLPGAPMIKDENWSALQQLADAGLIHNRAIVHRADDSVLRVMGADVVALRRGRGMAPYTLDFPGNRGMRVALGGEEKNTFALQKEERITVSQHIGHLDTCATSEFWQQEIKDFCRLLQVTPDCALHDRHPDYHSTQMAPSFAPRTVSVPHHQAHVYSCLAEHRLTERALALAWDGAGWGEDGTIWGGEAFLWDPVSRKLQPGASWYPFPWIGGDRFAREPRRSALALASVLFGSDIDPLFLSRFPEFEARILQHLLQNPRELLPTSSVARLFDAVASLLDLRQICSFEGQAALLLEGLADSCHDFMPFSIDILERENTWLCDWRPMLREILGAKRDQIPASIISTRFHHSLVALAETLLDKSGLQHLIVSGGVFQNRFLMETLKRRAPQRGYRVWSHGLVPPNDAGLAVGQLAWMSGKEIAPCV